MKRGLLILLLAPAPAFAQSSTDAYFYRLDLDGDRKVSLAEAAGHADVVLRFDRADRNRDGKLSTAEFKRLHKLKLPKPKKSDRTHTASR